MFKRECSGSVSVCLLYTRSGLDTVRGGKGLTFLKVGDF